ncbi:flagellar filament capping protein FliD [Rhodoplanes sp. TEM]|uniref:Flagellar hook-associated protein 2 n=1 Tax=Rhodoplanes tepidamans TaxID=200616 RepID=A0ABT5JBM9_RHOTP|nr:MULTISPECIES: flagellar filament capping protein FliD [Rhodoplanes]MDC7786786.1 flagellar filament capping protein FliD [Rhodoplanes tepidamans]MDC7987448.1 flagellar filament capping protein FliD [Rhodoplanes sp. TEM]MDQ0356342.1 flagellar hook-associated protein 2 [Rhodoplanes tepidamans]
MSTISSVTTSTSSTSTTSASVSTDWDALIEEAVEAKLSKADSIETKITANEAKISAYSEMQSLLQDVADAADALRAPTGTLAKENDVFQDRASYLTANGDVDATETVSVTADSGADIATYDLVITQVAKAHKVTSGSLASKSDDLGYAGVFSLTVDDGTAVNVTVTEDMSLADLAEAINNSSSSSGVQATVLQVSSGSYKLVLTATDTGKSITAAAVSGDDVLEELGILDEDGAFANEAQAAQDAIIELDGVTITRDSNEIDDAIDGVTFYLYNTTPDDTSISVEIESDYTAVKEAVQALVDAYNAYREWALTQQATTTSGTASDDAVLFGDGTLRNINRSIADALATSIDSLSLANIGITYDSSNNLELDEDALDDALLDNLDGIKALFAFELTSSSSDLMLLSRGSAAPSSFTLDVEVDEDGTITSASVDGNSALFTVSGSRIVGASGTIYEGFTFVFSGDADQSIDITTSYGLAEILYSAADTAADTNDGTLQSLIDDLEDVNSDYETKVSDIETKAEDYRTTLETRYANYQATISEAESMLAYLEAILAAEDD